MSDSNFQPIGDPEHGYWLNFSPGAAETQHEFCGEPDIPGSDCPHCNKPLLRILSLDAYDPVLNLDPNRTPQVHLLYCWTCSIPYGEFSYRLREDGSVELLQVPPRQPGIELGAGGPYDGYTGRFPLRRVSLELQSQSEHDTLTAYWAATSEQDYGEAPLEPRHQIGGYPFIYNPFALRCPLCSNFMAMLAAFCDDASGNQTYQADAMSSFTDNCGVQVFFQLCRDCAVVSAAHSCD